MKPGSPPARAPVLLVALATLLSAACENSGGTLYPDPFTPPPPPGQPVSLRGDIQPIFTARCATAGCHSAGDAMSGLVLAEGFLFDPVLGAVGVTSLEVPPMLRIAAGRSTDSYLVSKLTGAGIVGDRMPIGGTLDTAQIDLIRAWIDDGALDN